MLRTRSILLPKPGFTLAELMVSIAIAMILILGVNMVFRASSNTVSAGMTLSNANRQNLVVKTVLKNDLAQIATDGLLIIRSDQVYAYRNLTDKNTDTVGSKDTIALPGGNTYYVNRTRVNDRSHRVDRLAFFMRGNFTRQTAPPYDNGSPLSSSTTSTEAWVWYGHLAIPNNQWLKGKTNNTPTPHFFNPGGLDANGDTNDNNALASDWVLGRYATLLVNVGPSATSIPNKDGPYLWPGTPTSLWPLAADSGLGGGGPSRPDLYDSAFNTPIDIANTDIQSYLNLNDQLLENPQIDWPNRLIGVGLWRAGSPYLRVPPNNSNGVASSGASPLVTPYSADLTAPVLVRGCVHFIVEYAGDYLIQQPNGALDARQPADGLPHGDGETDFYVDPVTGDRKIRWYGMPRDINNDGRIDGSDVIPLRDLMPGHKAAPFERIDANAPSVGSPFPRVEDVLTDDPLDPAGKFDYAAYMKSNQNIPTYAYVCAWSRSMAAKGYLPRMLRITIGIDDPNGRLNNSQLFQYTFDLQ